MEEVVRARRAEALWAKGDSEAGGFLVAGRGRARPGPLLGSQGPGSVETGASRLRARVSLALSGRPVVQSPDRGAVPARPPVTRRGPFKRLSGGARARARASGGMACRAAPRAESSPAAATPQGSVGSRRGRKVSVSPAPDRRRLSPGPPLPRLRPRPAPVLPRPAAVG